MGMNRVQFQRGLSLPQFLRRFGTREQCLNALERARWPTGFRCPHCAGRAGSRFERGSQRLWQCQGCRKQTSVTAGTVLADTKLPLSTWLMALYFVAHAKNGIAALELSRHLGVCYRTAWRMKHKLMAALSGDESGRLLRGVVEVDDAYLGGERSGLPKGQQWQNKVPFVAAVDTHDGRPIHARFDCVSSFRRETMAHWARTALAPQARVVSDGLCAFAGVTEQGIAHEPYVVGRGRRAAQHPKLYWVNTVLSNLKTALSGTHHACKFHKYAPRYLGAYQYSFNHRFDLPRLVPLMLSAALLTKPLTEQALRALG